MLSIQPKPGPGWARVNSSKGDKMALAVSGPQCPGEVNRPGQGSGSWKDPVRRSNWGKSAFISFCPEPASASFSTGPAQRNAREENFSLVSVAEGSGILYLS